MTRREYAMDQQMCILAPTEPLESVALDQRGKAQQGARDYHRQVVSTYWYLLGMFMLGLFAVTVLTLSASFGA
jgi:hypothetical protein